jgi:hypothetical protein
MQPEKLIELVKASERGLSKTQAAELTKIPYRTVLIYAKKFSLTFACGKKIANARYRERSYQEQLQREQLQRLGSYGQELQALADTYRSSKESGPIQPNPAARRIRSAHEDSRSSTERTLKSKLSQANTDSQKREVAYWFKWYCHEKALIKQNKRPPFPKAERQSWEHQNFAKRESVERRGEILDSLRNGSRTANEIAKTTGFDVRSISLFMHNLFREGKVDRELIKTPDTNKNTVYLYTNTER